MQTKSRDADDLSRVARRRRLDHVQVLGDLVGAVHVDLQLVHAVEVEDPDAVLLQAFGARLRCGDRAFDAPLDRRQRINEKVDSRARADADDRVFDHVLERGRRNLLLEFGLVHACAA